MPGRGELLLTPGSLSPKHQCLDTKFRTVLLHLLPNGEDGAEPVGLFAGCRGTFAWCHHVATPVGSRVKHACYSLYLNCRTPPCPLPGAVLWSMG